MRHFLQVVEHREPAQLTAATRALYDADANTARFETAPVHVDGGNYLSFELADEPAAGALMVREVDLPPGDYLLRCDRVDFPPGGVAHLHTHPGPGLRVLLHGRIRIDNEGTSHEYGPFEWWFETGPDPVYAAASETEDTAFVRVLVLPAEWEGKRTITYVDPGDEEKPKLQRARIYFEERL
jgi:quercetin dioxygenase-like cupin family protein